MEKPNFTAAMGAYAVLAILAGLTLDGALRVAVWLLLGALAVKTWIQKLRESGSGDEE